MSADNWGICPKCVERHLARRASNAALLEEQYGKVDRKAYKKLEEAFEAIPEIYNKYELREDYEFVLFEDGRFLAIYRARCQNDECDFAFEFKHEEAVDF